MGMQTSPPLPHEAMEYPESDGQPMAQNTTQYLWITYIKDNFEYFYRDRPDVFVAGDLFWYPVEGNNVLCTAPDTMIAFGPPKGHRSSYMQWLEGNIAPQVVWEVLSPGNRPGEMREKFEFYERHGVEEYYLYDPDDGELQGWLRDGGRLRPVAQLRGWTSPRTGVRMDLDGLALVLIDPDGKPFKSYEECRSGEDEQRRARQIAEERAELERRKWEEEKVRAEQERWEKETAVARAEQERREKEAAETRAEQERHEKEAALARAEQLAAKMRVLGLDPDAV